MATPINGPVYIRNIYNNKVVYAHITRFELQFNQSVKIPKIVTPNPNNKGRASK